MNTHVSIKYLTKGGHLKLMELNDQIEFVEACAKNYYFFDPFKNLFVNPFLNKRIKPLRLEILFYYDGKEQFNKLLSSETLTLKQVDRTVEKIHYDAAIAKLVGICLSYFKWIGFILIASSFFSEKQFVILTVGLYFVYLDYTIFDSYYGFFYLIDELPRLMMFEILGH